MLSVLGPTYFQSIILSILKCIGILSARNMAAPLLRPPIAPGQEVHMSRTLTTIATGRFLHRTGWASRHSEIRRRRQAFFGGRSRCQSRGPPRCYQRLAGGRSVCYQRWRAISSGRQPILCHGTRTRGRASPPREHNPRRSQGHVSHAHRY